MARKIVQRPYQKAQPNEAAPTIGEGGLSGVPPVEPPVDLPGVPPAEPQVTKPAAESAAVNPSKPDPSLDIEDAQLAVRAIMREAAVARTDLGRFYGFVMREENTNARIVPTAHQLLMLDFIQHHYFCVLRLPVGTGKTYTITSVALWLLGNEPMSRGLLVGNTQNQSKKPLGMIKDYIEDTELSPELRAVFPKLARSSRDGDEWTQTVIKIDRPSGAKDPSMTAVGFDSRAVLGMRISFLVGDDIINSENSLTKEMREKLSAKFDANMVSRLDPRTARAIVANTPWNREDQTYHLEIEAQWPTLTMDIYGNIRVLNAEAAWLHRALDTHLRPSTIRVSDEHDWYRLRAHDPDPDEIVPLWPERYSTKTIADIKSRMRPHEFARSYLCEPMSDDDNRCQRDWVEKCKRRGINKTLKSYYDGPNLTYTGLDLGIGQGLHNDRTVFFTIELQPDGSRRLLDLDAGRWTGPDIIDKLVRKAGKYKSLIIVEGNAQQEWIKQFALESKKDLRVKTHITTKTNKAHKDFGIESIFDELRNGAWIIPCDADGRCHKEVQAWIDEMLYYQPPPAHTGDRLMACWFAREACRKGGRKDPAPRSGCPREMPRGGGF
ncbi:MAG: hypothetical protein GY854_02385 [Deltaproteobacteria bacterium]|nr:hypothetical protein [Deltaproteobacteria bacterium]